MTPDDFKIKQVYSFDVWSVPALGNDYNNCTVLAIMDQQSANQIIDTQALHIRVFPDLPAGTPNDPSAYNYVKLRTQAGVTTVLGFPWIKADSIELIQAVTITVSIANVTASDQARIQAALVQNGYNLLTFTVNPIGSPS